MTMENFHIVLIQSYHATEEKIEKYKMLIISLDVPIFKSTLWRNNMTESLKLKQFTSEFKSQSSPLFELEHTQTET